MIIYQEIHTNACILIELNTSSALYWFGGKLVKVYSKIMLRMSVVSHFPMPTGAKIIVANHPTGTDPFVIFSIMKVKVSILIVNLAFKVPIFGRYIDYIGHIPVNNKKAYLAFKKALKILKDGGTVVIFIEGGISPFADVFLKPRTGPVRLALETGASIVPIGIGIKYANIRNISATISDVNAFGKWYFHGPYAVTIGKSIKLSGNVKNRSLVRNLSNRIMGRIKKLATESSSRVA